jgi:hypothetical protein
MVAGRAGRAWLGRLPPRAGKFHTVPGLRDVNWPRVATVRASKPPADLGSDRYAPILATHMHALAPLLQAGHPVDAREGEPAEEGAPAARAAALGRHRRYR